MLNKVSSHSPKSAWAALAEYIARIDDERIRQSIRELDILLSHSASLSVTITAAGCLVAYLLATMESTVTMPGIQYFHAIGLGADWSRISASTGLYTLFSASLVLTLIVASLIMLARNRLVEHLTSFYRSPQESLHVWLLCHAGGVDLQVLTLASSLSFVVRVVLVTFTVGLCIFVFTIHPMAGLICMLLMSFWPVSSRIVSNGEAPPHRTPYKTLSSSQAAPSQLQPRDPRRPDSDVGALSTQQDNVARTAFSSRQAGAGSSYPKGRRISDFDILDGIDTILVDDFVLHEHMMDVLREPQANPGDIIHFVLAVIRRRVPGEVACGSLASPLDLRPMQRDAWSAVTDITALAATHFLDQSRARLLAWPAWMGDALVILLSHSEYALTSAACEALSVCLRRRIDDVSKTIAQRSPDGDYLEFTRILRRLQDVFPCLEPDEIAIGLHTIIMHRLISPQKPIAKQTSFGDVLKDYPELPVYTVSAILSIATDCASRVQEKDSAGLICDSTAVYHDVLSVDVPQTARSDLHRLTVKLLMNPTSAYICLKSAAAVGEEYRSPDESTLSAFRGAFVQAEAFERMRMLRTTILTYRTHCKGMDTSGLLHPVRICRLFCHILKAVRDFEGTLSAQEDAEWREFWAQLTKAFDGPWYNGPPIPALVKECLFLIDEQDAYHQEAKTGDPLTAEPQTDGCQAAEYQQWCNSFDLPSSLFPDALIQTLSQSGHNMSRRVRRLRELKCAEGY